MPMPIKNIAGRRFGKLTALRMLHTNKGGGGATWECLCDCGNIKNVQIGNLRPRGIISCGCIRESRRYTLGGLCKKHKSTYNSWKDMLSRCDDSTHPSYKNYGGRGIKVSEDWHKFENFLFDMGPKPPGRSIDRIDNDVGYSKENCRWADRKTQARNTRKNHWVEINGQRKIIADWALELGISPITVASRLNQGWDEQRAIVTPVKSKRKL
jgi:hypothetical protein